MCHPGHQSNTCPANYSLFNLSCGLISSKGDSEKEVFMKGNTELERGLCGEVVEGPKIHL